MVNTVAAPFDRTVLPIPEPEHPPITEIDARKATPPTRFEVKAPPRAPNVMVVLIDNLGFGATKPFGGAISMPTLIMAGRSAAISWTGVNRLLARLVRQ